MAGEPVRIYGKTTKVDRHMERVMDLLYDYGPHTSNQIAEHLGVSSGWVHEIMALMRADGTVTTMTRFEPTFKGPPHRLVYWILKEDAIAA